MAIIDYFPATLAADGNGNTVKNAAAQVYALADTALSTPLALTDLQGVPMTELRSSDLGIFPAFRVVNQTMQIVVVSGSLRTPMTSLSVYANAAEAAAAMASGNAGAAAASAQAAELARQNATAAQAAAVEAAAAAAAVGSTNDTITEGLLKNPASKTATALDGVIDEATASKANAADVYSKTVTDRAFSPKGLPAYASARTGAYDRDRSVYNAKAEQLRLVRAQLAKVKAGTGDLIIGTLGDSTFAGSQAVPGQSTAPDQLRRILADRGYRSKGEFVAINKKFNGATPDFGDNSGRIVAGAGWARVFDYSNIVQGAASAGALTVTPGVAGTIARVYFNRNAGSAFTVEIDGSVVATVTLSSPSPATATITSGTGTLTASTQISMYEITGLSNAIHAVKITPLNGNVVQLYAVEVSDALPGVRLINVAIGGTTASQLTANQFAQVNILNQSVIRPHLLLLCSQINGLSRPTESGNPVSVAKYQTDVVAPYKTKVLEALTAFETPSPAPARVIVTANPVQGLDAESDTYPLTTDALYQVADAKDIRLIDHLARWSWTEYNNAGLMGDPSHPNPAGYYEKALMMYFGLEL
ncbi:MAG: hypothetical protein K0S37_2615 [Microbacterium sp.]|nr:hypothetical protein [Microbacterium sp.]